MRVFVTGASGFIGSAVVAELLGAGHQVLGLARSDASAAALAAAGAEAHRGDLEDLDSLRRGAATADGVIHTAYDHAFTDFAAAAQKDRLAIEAMGEALVGTGRPLVITSGMMGTPGHVATEASVPEPGSFGALRFASEEAALSFAERGVRASVVRCPPSVHGNGDHHGFIPRIIDTARTKGFSAYPGDGSNRWPAVHRLDAARLFRLALEDAPAGTRLLAVGDDGVPVREIAEVIGRHLQLPVTSIPREEAAGHFGFLGVFFSLDVPASSAQTRQRLGWGPVQPGLIADLEEGHYFSEERQHARETSVRPPQYQQQR
jgi:nucleoside-diphosphate-sugar epimerase